MAEAERVFKAAILIAPKGYIPMTLFIEHYTLVIATLLHDAHGVTEELFETLE